jgi:YggT family protein
VIADVINVTFMVLTIAVFIRVLLSWIPNIDPRNPAIEFLYGITEPILAPIRSIMPRTLMFDFSPMIAIFVLQAIRAVLLSNLPQ